MPDYTAQPNALAAFRDSYATARGLNDELAKRKAGGLLAGGDTMGAANLLARRGLTGESDNMLAAGARRESYGRAKQVGADFNEDPKKAAATAAAGGDVQGAMAILNHVEGMDAKSRSRFKETNDELARMTFWLASVPPEQREQRRATILQSLSSMFPDPNAPEVRAAVQRFQTMPLDDGSLQAQASRVIGMDKLLGTYSMREEGDDMVTYRTTPFGPPVEVGRRTQPMTRADRRADRALQIREEDEAEQDASVTPSKVMGPIYAKLARGEPLTPGEEAAMKYYKMDPLTAGALSDTGGYGADDGDADEYARPGSNPRPAAPVAAKPPPARTAPGRAQPAAGRARENPVRPRSRAEAAALPRGTWFVDPAGNLIQKK